MGGGRRREDEDEDEDDEAQQRGGPTLINGGELRQQPFQLVAQLGHALVAERFVEERLARVPAIFGRKEGSRETTTDDDDDRRRPTTDDAV